MNEKYIHYHKNGAVTCRLEISTSGVTDGCDDFLSRHISALIECFNEKISPAADLVFESACERDRGYRFRPFDVAARYEAKTEKHKILLLVSIICSERRNIVCSHESAHVFRLKHGGWYYVGKGGKRLFNGEGICHI